MTPDSEKFLAGFLAALQYIIIGCGQEAVAENAMRDSGYSMKDFINVQKKSGYKTKKMNRVIREAFRIKQQS